MTAIDYAALVERLRKYAGPVAGRDKNECMASEAADALERLTQPGGEVEPVRWVQYDIYGDVFSTSVSRKHPSDGPLYSAATVARLIAERGEANKLRTRYFNEMCEVIEKNDALQEQVKVLRGALESISDYWNHDRNDMAMFNALEHAEITAFEALAATEPKEQV